MVTMPKSTAAKLLIYILLISVIPLSVVGFVTYFLGQNITENQVKNHLASVAILKEQEIINWARHIEYGVNQAVSDPRVKKEVEALTTNAIDTPLHSTSHDALESYFRRITSLKNSELLVMNLLDRNTGQIIVSSDDKWEGQFRDDRRYFNEGKSSVYLSNIYHSFTLDQPILVIAAPLLNSSGQLLAVMAATVSLEGINEIMQERTGLSVTTETFLVNKDNMLITDTVYAPDGAFKKWMFGEGVERAKAGEQGVDVFIDYRGETVIGSYRWVEGLDLALIAKQDQTEALASLKGMQNYIILMFGIIIVFAVLLYLALYRSIGKPIKQLVEATRRVAQGNLNHRVDITGGGEISTLAKSFNQMTENLTIITASRNELNKEMSERKQVEETLIESEEKFRKVFEDSRSGMSLFDQQGRYIKVNKALTEILGYSEPELLSMGAKDITYQGDITPDDIIVQQLWTGESDGFSAEKRFVHKDGHVIWSAITVSPIRDSNGQTMYLLGQIENITERKQVEEALRVSEQNFHNSLDNSPLGIRIVNTERENLYVNQAMLDIYGYSNIEEFTNIIPQERYTPESHARYLEREARRTRGEVIADPYEISIFRKDGKICHLLSSRQKIIWNGEIHTMVIQEDITERKVTDQIKDEFIGMVSHELKTPLTVIMGVLNVLANHGLSEKEVFELLNDAISSADVMADIVENLLELSRSQAGHLILQVEPTDVVEIAQTIARRLRNKLAIHRLIVDSSSGPAVALADAVKVERILHNLVENAIKYSPKGGDVRVSAHRQDNQLVVEVSDQGIGISREDQSRLFQSFERIDAYKTNSIAGIGLGLRVCRLLVEALGGRIWIESEPGKGSSFFFTLPVAESNNQARS